MKEQKYKKRRSYTLKLSKEQLDQMSAINLINRFMGGWFSTRRKLEDIENINPRWLEEQKYKRFPPFGQQSKEDLIINNDRIKIRKSKKGYVIEMIFKWRSKGFNIENLRCSWCKKFKPISWEGICESCEKKLKKERKFLKHVRGELRNEG